MYFEVKKKSALTSMLLDRVSIPLPICTSIYAYDCYEH